VIASLNHPNICTLYDVGPDYLVMELVNGPTLVDRISGALFFNDHAALAAAIEFKAAIEDKEIPSEWLDWYQAMSQVI
jgi:hypothetical protein